MLVFNSSPAVKMDMILPVEILRCPEILKIAHKTKTSINTEIEKPMMHAENVAKILSVGMGPEKMIMLLDRNQKNNQNNNFFQFSKSCCSL